MRFYDMLPQKEDYSSILDNKTYQDINFLPCEMDDIVATLPNEILEDLKTIKQDLFLGMCHDDMNLILNEIWKITIDKCKNHIQIDELIRIGINSDELLGDTKAHIIFTIFMSFKYRENIWKSFNRFISNAHDMTSREFYHNKGSGGGGYGKKFLNMISEIYEDKTNDSKRNIQTSEFYYCIDNTFKLNEKGKKNGYLVNFKDEKLFLSILDNWKKACPYSKKNSQGISFEKLNQFGRELKEQTVELYTKHADYCLRAYAIERLFKLSFLYELSSHIRDSYKENYSRAAGPLKELANITAFPMIFSSNRYIEKIHNAVFRTKHKDHGSIKAFLEAQTRLEGVIDVEAHIRYFSEYVFYLLQSVFYYLLLLYEEAKSSQNGERINASIIEQYLEQYIESNKEQYQYDNILHNIDRLDIYCIPEEVQVNITELVYNYENRISFIKKSKSISAYLLDGSVNLLLKDKYSFENYYNNFPNNVIYANYLKGPRKP